MRQNTKELKEEEEEEKTKKETENQKKNEKEKDEEEEHQPQEEEKEENGMRHPFSQSSLFTPERKRDAKRLQKGKTPLSKIHNKQICRQ